MVQKAARFFGLQITYVEDLKRLCLKVLQSNRPQLHWEFPRAAYLVQFYLFSLLKSYCVCVRRRIWV